MQPRPGRRESDGPPGPRPSGSPSAPHSSRARWPRPWRGPPSSQQPEEAAGDPAEGVCVAWVTREVSHGGPSPEISPSVGRKSRTLRRRLCCLPTSQPGRSSTRESTPGLLPSVEPRRDLGLAPEAPRNCGTPRQGSELGFFFPNAQLHKLSKLLRPQLLFPLALIGGPAPTWGGRRLFRLVPIARPWSLPDSLLAAH